jgi:hypothetical protein
MTLLFDTPCNNSNRRRHYILRKTGGRTKLTLNKSTLSPEKLAGAEACAVECLEDGRLLLPDERVAFAMSLSVAQVNALKASGILPSIEFPERYGSRFRMIKRVPAEELLNFVRSRTQVSRL